MTAAEWLASIGLSKKVNIKGQVIDLRPHIASVPGDGKERVMVIGAARRLLIKRGADGVMLPASEADE
ncbi:MAG: hypothetical protein ABIT76_08865 [Chthoniobacterales bacterium]